MLRAEVVHGRQCGADVGQHELLVVGRRQRPGPGVEQLDGAGPREDLHAQEAPGDPGQPVGEVMPQRRIAVHQRLGARVVTARSALDEVAGKGERSSGEADQRGAAQRSGRAGQSPHGLEHGRHVLVGEVAQRSHPAGITDGLGHHGADAGDDVEVDADRPQRDDDVGEEDRSVHMVPPDRLIGDLDDEVGGEAGLEHRCALAHLAVLRQGPARLSHEPHGGVVHRLPPGRPQQKRVRRASGNEWVIGAEAPRGGPCRWAGWGLGGH